MPILIQLLSIQFPAEAISVPCSFLIACFCMQSDDFFIAKSNSAKVNFALSGFG